MRPASHLVKIAIYMRKDAVRHRQQIFPTSIAPHACNRITAMQCGCLGHAISALHLASKARVAPSAYHNVEIDCEKFIRTERIWR